MSVDPAHDRLANLLSGQGTPDWNGIDYVEVAGADGTELRVHFLNTVSVRGTFSATPPVVICGGQVPGSLDVVPIDESTAWSADPAGRPVLSVSIAGPGDSSTYTLTVHSTVLDPYFDTVAFTFPSDAAGAVDCRPQAGPSAPPPSADVTVSYLAKDYAGFKQALLDFSALHYPRWVERSEADLGIMLAEALSAIADELSYLQDRVAAEATLGTATQRLSLLRHARLVDYDASPALAATTTLQFEVAPGTTSLTTGLRCSAAGPDGQRVPFEVGAALADPASGRRVSASYVVDPRWNAGPASDRNLQPYWWDISRQQLPAGSQRLWLMGHGHGFSPGQQLLLDTSAAESPDPPIREIVTIDAAAETSDGVFDVALTRIDLRSPTRVDHDLARTHLAGNLLPAAHGLRVTESFAVPRDVVVRAAANATPDDARPEYRYTLQAEQISWLPRQSTAYLPALAPPSSVALTSSGTGGTLSPGTYAYQVTAVNANGETTALPAVEVEATEPGSSVRVTWQPVQATATYNVYGRVPGSLGKLAGVGPFAAQAPLEYIDTGASTPAASRPPPSSNTTAGPGSAGGDGDLGREFGAVPQLALASAPGAEPWRWERWLLAAGPADAVFTLTPERYVAVGARAAGAWFDYDGDGVTIRFGDGAFGLAPTPDTAFTVTYVAGGGVVGNVPADTIVQVDPGEPQAGAVLAVTNPLSAAGGAEPETPQQIRDRAPYAFQGNPLRVVLDDDYVQAAKSLSWVMQAGTSFRWTGSWLTAFTTADPQASETLSVAQLEQLSDLLGRRRLAGYESYVLAPRFVSLDLAITIVAEPSAFATDVHDAVVASLRPGVRPDGSRGFFDHDRWSFGQPLEASALLAAVQRVPGVLGVTSVRYRQRGLQSALLPLPQSVAIPADQILRLDDDPNAPGAGSLHVVVEAAI
jgi:hypothetical protein